MKAKSLGLFSYFLMGALFLSNFSYANFDPERSAKVLNSLETQRFLYMLEQSDAVRAYESSLHKDLSVLNEKNLEYIYNQQQLAEEKQDFKRSVKEKLQNDLKLMFRGTKDQPLYKSLSEVDFETDILNYELVKKFVNAESCQYNFQYFVGCAEALKLILQLTTKLDKSVSQKSAVLTIANALRLTANNKLKIRASIADFFHILISSNKNQEISSIISDKYSFSELRKNELKGYQNLYAKKEKIISLIKYIENLASLNSIEQKAWAEVLSQFFINAYDPHSEIISLAEQKVFQQGKKIGGIGVILSKKENYYIIENLVNDGPAKKAGIQKYSILTKVNGENINQLPFDQLIQKLQGEPGESLTVEVIKEKITQTFRLKRELIVPNTINTEIYSFNENKYLKIQFSDFMRDNLCLEIRKAILEHRDAEGIILDIRNNDGGRVSYAGCIAEMFLPASSIYFISKKDNLVNELRTQHKPIFRNKLAVLVNSSSASASEVISLAFKDYQRGLIVGQKTFGKGSMQNPYAIELANQIFIKLTESLFYAPSGYTNQTIGIQPDIEVSTSEEEKYALREADLFFFPIQPDRVQTSFVKPAHSLEVNSDCMHSLNVEKKYNSLEVTDPMKDLYVLKALAGMECLK